MKTYDHFMECQDWVKYFQQIFDGINVKNCLEFGLGEGTEFFLDNCEHVTSLEISVSGINDGWYKRCKEKYKENKNWECIYYKAGQDIITANELAINNKYPIEFKEHIKELKVLINTLNKPYDIAFVDSGIHNRGDIVNILFDKNDIDIIAAHDTSRTDRIVKNIYGYNIVNIPKDFLEFHFEDTYMGSTFWIRKNKLNVIKILKEMIS